MNILFFYSHPFNPSSGGIESVTDCITRALISIPGYEVFYLCGYVESKDNEFDFPVDQHYLPCEGLFDNDDNIHYFQSFLKINKIDIVISQSGAWSYMLPMLGLENCKYVSVIHCDPNLDVINFDANYLNVSNSRCRIVKKVIKFLLYPIYGLFLRFRVIANARNHYNRLVTESDQVIVLSKKYIPKLCSLIGFPSPKIRYINNPTPYPISDIDYSKKGKIVLYVGRLESLQKQPIELLKIWKMIYRDFPEWKLVLVGDGECRLDLEAYVRCHKLERVFFEGKKENVDDYYKQASILCLVSRIEGQPMVLVEGMTKGCIPISYNSFAAVHDMIDDDINGFIIPYKKKRIFANTLRKLMADPKLIRDMASASQEKVKQFSQKRIIDEWIRLFMDLNNGR